MKRSFCYEQWNILLYNIEICILQTNLVVELRLSTQFATEIFSRIGSWTTKCFSYFGHIDDNGFDAIAFSLNFGCNTGHFVTVENVRNVSIHVKSTHFYVLRWSQFWGAIEFECWK